MSATSETSTVCPFRVHGFTSGFSGVRVTQYAVFCAMFCRSAYEYLKHAAVMSFHRQNVTSDINKTKHHTTDVAHIDNFFFLGWGVRNSRYNAKLTDPINYISLFKMSIHRTISLHKHTSLIKRFVANILTFSCRIYT